MQKMKSYTRQRAESKSYKQQFNDVKMKRPSMQSAAALHTTSQKTNNCLFCDSAEHKSEHCPDHNIPERKERLKKMGRCFVCLGQKHTAKFCKFKDMSCEKCGKRHHIAACNGKKSEVQSPPEPAETAVSSVISHSVKMKPDGQNTVLLQTARAWVGGPSGMKIAVAY